MNYKKFYRRFLKGHAKKLHMACHSHHFWPDVTRKAMLEYWDDSAKFSDQKWNIIFGEKIPMLQKIIAQHLKISRPDHIVFAPNTHDLLVRLLSTLDFRKRPKILTTNSEFHSFARQIKRLEAENAIEVTRIDLLDDNDFWQQYQQYTQKISFDLIFVSHVFFNSGKSIHDINRLLDTVKPQGKIALDGYHSYFALPVNLSALENRIYFIAGHYKYAAGGEGLCFMTCPPGKDRPVITGWFAEFESLSARKDEIAYPTHGGRYLGSTMDFSPLYRALSVYKLLSHHGIDVNIIHQHVQTLQRHFLNILDEINSSTLNRAMLINKNSEKRGHFLVFKCPDVKTCQQLEQRLRNHDICTDARAEYLRFGFALYLDQNDLERIRIIKNF